MSFSTLATDKVIDKNQQLQGLPIKAVYRDNLVGIRYLHPKDTINSNPTYRRFQLTFASAALTNEFINSICTVCPCKLNPPNVPNLNPIPAPSQNLLPKTRDLPQLPSRMNVPVDLNVPLVSRSAPMSGCLAPPDKPVFQMPLSSPQFIGSSQQEKDIFQLTSSPANVYSDQSQFCNIQDTRSHLGHLHHHETGTRSQQHSQLHFPESQLSSQDRQPQNQSLGSKSDGQAEPATDKMRHELLSALQEFQNTELYDLSPDALEEIVGGIVHEKGFLIVSQLKSLEKLWAIKDLARSYI